MKTSHYIIIAIVSYLFFMLLLTPASSLLGLVQLPKQLQLNGVSGSIWNGQVSQLKFSNYNVDNLDWSLHPLPLLTGSVSTDLQADVFTNTINTRANYSFISQQLQLAELNSEISASELQQQLALPFGELDGSISLKADSVEIISGQLPKITGLLSWRKASLTLAETVAFGDLFIRIEPDDQGGLKADISNVKGQLSIKGLLTISDKQIYSLNLKLTPRANAPEQLMGMLRLIAPSKKGGDHLINRSGHLRQLGIRL